jgi:hypothetical protein
VTGAVRYVLGEGRGAGNDNLPLGQQSRVEWIGGTGFGFEIRTDADVDLARRIMEFDALNQGSKTRRCEKDAVHLSLSWRPGQTPSRAEMEEAALGALKSIGMENAKAIFAAHSDENYFHMHLVASRISPDTGRAYDLKGNYLSLSAWAEAWERDHGGIISLKRESNNALRAAIKERDAAKVLTAMTTQRATFTERELERTLGKQIIDQKEREQFAAQVLGLPDAIPLMDVAGGPITRFTSAAVLEAEQKVLDAVAGLERTNWHGVDPSVILARPDFSSMSAEQATAVRHATQVSGIALIDGQAGTGKSYTVGAIRQVYTRAGYNVIGLAPTNALASDMRDSGFSYAVTLHSELFKLNSNRGTWNGCTLVVIDEAAMVDTKLMAEVTRHAQEAGAKLLLVGDDRQLSSIDHGGMFSVLKHRYGAAELSEVRRQTKQDDRRISELLAVGNYDTALRMFDAKGAIHWQRSQEMARADLVRHWAKDSAEAPTKSRFVFAYVNDDVDQLNADLRAVRKARGELKGREHHFKTKHGVAVFAEHDRIQITGTDKAWHLENGATGTIEKIEGDTIGLRLDGRQKKLVTFDVKQFPDFRHGYAGTIHKGQGKSLDETYLYHTEAWRSAASYVALTRHRHKAELFVATNTAADIKELSKQLSRVDERRAASHFHRVDSSRSQELPQMATAGSAAVSPDTKPHAADKKADQGLPSEDALMRQADLEKQRLQELQGHEERAQAFRRAKQIEFDEADSKRSENKQQVEAHEVDISCASARYAIALGDNYNIRDPYGSLARAAMSDYAMFHRSQEKLRVEMAAENDPNKRRVIDLRRNIEACDYMAITSDRLAGISTATTGRKDAPQVVLDRERAADYRAQAAALRAERAELIEFIRDPGQASAVMSSGAAQHAETVPAGKEPEAPQSTPAPVLAQTQVPANDPGVAVPTTVTPSPMPATAPDNVAAVAKVPETLVASSEEMPPVEPLTARASGPSSAPDTVAPTPTPFTISPVFSRSDVIAPPLTFHVTVAKPAPILAAVTEPGPVAESLDAAKAPVEQSERESAASTPNSKPDVAAPGSTPFKIDPGLSRSDVIAPPPSSHVSISKSAPSETMPLVPPERQGTEPTWYEALRAKVEAGGPVSKEAMSDQTITRLAKRLQQDKSPSEATNDKGNDKGADDSGPEPEM